MPYKAMAAPWIVAADKMLAHFPPKEGLDKKETAGLETSVAAVLYQEGMQMNAWFLLGMTVMGIGSFRVIKYLDDKARDADARKNTMSAGEMQARLKAERDRSSQPTPSAPVNGHSPGVTVGGSAANAGDEPEPQNKPMTAEQAVALINFPKGGN